MINIKLRVVHNLKGVSLAILAVLAIWFPSIWFVDVLFALVGGRPAKLIAWSAALCIAISAALYLRWLKPCINKDVATCMLLALFAAVYFWSCQMVIPPTYNNLQALSICVLLPAAMFLGLSCRSTNPGFVLAIIGGSVALLIFYGVVSGRSAVVSDEFQSYLPISTSEDEKNTGYQGLSIVAGFLPVYILATLNRQNRHWMSRLCWLLVATVPVFMIGGRSAVVALVTTVVFWLFANAFSSQKTRILSAEIVTIFICAIIVIWIFPTQSPLGIQRLLWLQDASVIESSDRLELFGQALSIWLSSPSALIIGVGPQHFPLIAGYNEVGMHPHNWILELLAEYGIVGLAVFVLPLIAALFVVIIKHGRHARASISIYFLLYYTVTFLFSGALQSIWPLFFLAGWSVVECRDCSDRV